MRRSLTLTACACLTATMLVACDQQQSEDASAQDDADNPVIVTVDGTALRQSDMAAIFETMPQDARIPPAMMYDSLLSEMVDRHLAIKAAKAAGYEDKDDIKEQLDFALGQILRRAWIFDEIDRRLDDERLRSAYDAKYADYEGEPERHARHILVETEKQAIEIIEEINNGGDFIALANEHSTDPVSVDGDLGYFGRGVMVPEFDEATFALEVGTTSQEPVKSDFGYHIILVEDERITTAPAYEEVVESLRQEESLKVYDEIVQSLRDNAEIVYADEEEMTEPEVLPPPEEAEEVPAE